MRDALLLVLIPTLAAAIVAAACDVTLSDTGESSDAGDADVVNPAPSSDAGAPTGAAGTGLGTGLPCEVQGIIENRCLACHGGTSPPPLLRYEDLTAKSQKDPTKTMAEMSLEEMKAKQMPPPPATPPEDDEILAFEQWVKAGTKKNAVSCTDAPPVDGGTGTDGGNDAKCTSGKTWTDGNQGSPSMHPGAACNACHQTSGGPNLRIAGTVYPSLHEPNDCSGAAPPPLITVTVTDSRGRIAAMPVNEAGNFLTTMRLTPPFKATVTNGIQTRSMVGTVNSGDCNSCHTVQGDNKAPGRILAP